MFSANFVEILNTVMKTLRKIPQMVKLLKMRTINDTSPTPSFHQYRHQVYFLRLVHFAQETSTNCPHKPKLSTWQIPHHHIVFEPNKFIQKTQNLNWSEILYNIEEKRRQSSLQQKLDSKKTNINTVFLDRQTWNYCVWPGRIDSNFMWTIKLDLRKKEMEKCWRNVVSVEGWLHQSNCRAKSHRTMPFIACGSGSGLRTHRWRDNISGITSVAVGFEVAKRSNLLEAVKAGDSSNGIFSGTVPWLQTHNKHWMSWFLALTLSQYALKCQGVVLHMQERGWSNCFGGTCGKVTNNVQSTWQVLNESLVELHNQVPPVCHRWGSPTSGMGITWIVAAQRWSKWDSPPWLTPMSDLASFLPKGKVSRHHQRWSAFQNQTRLLFLKIERVINVWVREIEGGNAERKEENVKMNLRTHWANSLSCAEWKPNHCAGHALAVVATTTPKRLRKTMDVKKKWSKELLCCACITKTNLSQGHGIHGREQLLVSLLRFAHDRACVVDFILSTRSVWVLKYFLHLSGEILLKYLCSSLQLK